MRALPINPAALVANPKAGIERRAPRWEPIANCFFLDGLELPVTAQAPAEWLDRAVNTEPRNDFLQLLSRPNSAHVTAVVDQLMHKQRAIARQHEALVIDGDPRHLHRSELLAVERIE